MQRVTKYRQCLVESINLDSSRLNIDLANFNKKDSQRSRVFKNRTTRKYMDKQILTPAPKVNFSTVQSTLPIVLESSSQSITKNPYTSILKRQITLQDVEQSRAVLTQRLQDQENMNYAMKKYPYGKERVQISEDVLQRYKKQQYLNQSRILQKFEQQAKQYQQSLKNRRKFVSPDSDRRNKMSQQRLNNQFSRIKQSKNQKKLQKAQREKNLAMKRIENMMRNISYQIDNNSMILERGIKQIRDKIPERKKSSILKVANFKYADTLDFQKQRLARKVPLVVYKNKILDARDYYSNLNYSSLESEKLNAENYRYNSQQYDQLIKVLNDNKKRLNYLTQLQEKCYSNAVIF